MAKNDSTNKKVIALIDSVNTFVITTFGNGDETPALGYLPFIKHGSEFYIFTSSLTEHGQNLKAGKSAKVMFIEDEKTASKIPARTRAIFDVKYKKISVSENENILDMFESDIDEAYASMRMLPDFILYKFELHNGRYVQGFGAAFKQNADGEWNHLKF